MADDFHLVIPSKQRCRNGFERRTGSSAARAWKISSYIMTCLNKFRDYVEE
jgi:hypothetical protein